MAGNFSRTASSRKRRHRGGGGSAADGASGLTGPTLCLARVLSDPHWSQLSTIRTYSDSTITRKAVRP
jgi:hypothetical protein